MCTEPGFPVWSSSCAMRVPIEFTVRDMIGGAYRPMGSANGGIQMRVGNGDDWWCT